jgi:hypothetical protein
VDDGCRQSWLAHEPSSPPINFGAGTPFVMSGKCSNHYTMQYGPHPMTFESSECQVDSRLSAFIVYEDVTTGKLAKETCDILSKRLGADWPIEVEMFSFKSLYMRRIQRLASMASTNANLIVFSCYDRDLPFEVRKWTESCLQRPPWPTALVALTASTTWRTGAPATVEKYLADLAQRRGMQFFSRLDAAVAGVGTGQLMPVNQKEPIHDSSCATEFSDQYPGGLHWI